ncbi:CdaR family transcriptional regulator [Rhodoferax koreense]|uniref:CdaR family transcriptional regulator n=1 Tax=Rhodoferax koreensis TaxID=1842727 RepID=A0A1P8JY06_9BURK|nr:helix-turn-helix domain-containing protein [Rhodoferax koreense]APW38626.1 CdaR family transcriptional regulator [Rhodoferax koreense]
MPLDANVEHLLADLVRLLNHGASADEFSRRLALAEALPDAARRADLVEVVRMAMAVRNRLEFQQQRERGMLAVSESAQDLSSRLELNDVLHAIVVRARKLLGSHLAWLSVYDPVVGEFQALAADGALSQGVSRMTAGRDLGVAGLVMSTRLPFTTPDYLHDTRFRHDPALDDTFRAEGIAALVGLPLIWDQEVIGLLFVADRYHRTHDALSVSILSTLATHGAVAIRNAMAFEQAASALRNAEAARAELERHTRNIQAAADAHEQLTSLLAKGASLSELCGSVAQLLGGSVLIVDEASHVISEGIAPGHASDAAAAYDPHGPRSDAIRQALNTSRREGRSVVAYQTEHDICRVMSVIGGRDVLGAILLFRRDALDALSVRTFERTASVVGIVLLSQERMEAAKTRDASALLRNMVSFRQDEPALMRDRAERFGVNLGQPLSLLLVEIDGLEAGYVIRRLRTGSPLPGTLSDEVDGAIAVLCNTTRAGDVVQSFTALAGREFGLGYRGVLSKPVRAVEELPALYAALRRALAILGRLGVKGHILGQNEMALYSVLFETHDRASLDAYLRATLGAVLAQEEKRSAEMLATLLCYFDHNQNAKETAQHLGLHVNTVRQRLSTIEDLVGHWGHATRALEVHVALRLWHLSRPTV